MSCSVSILLMSVVLQNTIKKKGTDINYSVVVLLII